jgi:hypothetical protein
MTNQILGQAEDALTFAAVKYCLVELLRALDDDSDADDCIVFFRPSFGRSRPPQFGEFDFIIGTPRAVYPGESKWPGSSGYVPGGGFVLPAEQLRRHKIFHVYREAWQARISDDWKGVAGAAAPGLAALGWFPPPADTRLARTLHALLSHLGKCGRKNVDVLLFVQPEGKVYPPPASCPGFMVVSIVCPVVVGDFVRL